MSQHQTYKEALLSAIQCLDDAEGHAMSAILNVAFAGPDKELGRLYDLGEIFEMEPAMFRDTGDINIDAILKLVESIQQVKESIKNINALE